MRAVSQGRIRTLVRNCKWPVALGLVGIDLLMDNSSLISVFAHFALTNKKKPLNIFPDISRDHLLNSIPESTEVSKSDT